MSEKVKERNGLIGFLKDMWGWKQQENSDYDISIEEIELDEDLRKAFKESDIRIGNLENSLYGHNIEGEKRNFSQLKERIATRTPQSKQATKEKVRSKGNEIAD